MAPYLRILAGTGTNLTPITHLVNTTNSFPLVSDRFEGEVIVCIKDLTSPEKDNYNYFERSERQGVTWSIQVRGRFLQPISANDVLFGNTFDRELGLPWGSSAALKLMNYIDPTLEHDLTSKTHPWALSPLISTMTHFVHTRIDQQTDEDDHDPLTLSEDRPSLSSGPFPPTQPLSDDTSQLHLAGSDTTSSSSGSSAYHHGSTSSLASTLSASATSSYLPADAFSGSSKNTMIHSVKQRIKSKGKRKKERPGLGLVNAAQRRAYFTSATHRQDITFGPEDILTMDFCYGFLEFSPSLMLRLPGGLSFDLMRYWDGQCVRFVCCERHRDDVGGTDHQPPWGEVFWSVTIEKCEEEESG